MKLYAYTHDILDKLGHNVSLSQYTGITEEVAVAKFGTPSDIIDMYEIQNMFNDVESIETDWIYLAVR